MSSTIHYELGLFDTLTSYQQKVCVFCAMQAFLADCTFWTQIETKRENIFFLKRYVTNTGETSKLLLHS